MASQEDLAEVMQSALEQSGDLAFLRVQLEENLASIASQPQSLSQGSSTKAEIAKPIMPNEVYLVNELIRDFLKTTGCEKTVAVLVTESGLPLEPMTSHELRKAFTSGRKIDRNGPLLSTMVDHLLKK